MKSASVQTVRISIVSIRDGVVELRGGEYRAVLEVGGTASPFEDEARQEAMLASFAAFLNALAYAIQIVVRATPVDLTRYVATVEERARQMVLPQLVALAHDHAAFVQGLTRQRALLERRFYVVIPSESRTSSGWWSGWHRGRRRAADDQPHREAAQRQLTFRCDEIARQLGRCGLNARRLADLELAQLYLTCWSPERARAQRFRQQLDDYTTLAVRAVEGNSSGGDGRAAI